MDQTSGISELRHARPGGRVLALRAVSKQFQAGDRVVEALRDVDLDVGQGEFLAIVGRSGSGKSTLLNLIAGIDQPTSGTVSAGGRRVDEMTQDQLSIWRGTHVGVVFQFFQLLPTLTVIENVMLPMDLRGTFPSRERESRARELLARVDVESQADKLPHELSGGQQQRVAIARALANAPSMLVADEPTGNLDSATAEAVLDLFSELQREGMTIVVVSHEREIVRWASRTVEIRDGRLLGEGERKAESPDAVREVAS